MRKLILFLIAIIGVTFISSCKKDEVKTVIGTNFLAPALTSGVTTGSTVTLNKANKDVMLNIVWSSANYGFRASVTYTLQMDKKGNNFAAPVSVGTRTSVMLAAVDTAQLTTNDLNNKLLLWQADPENPVSTPVEFRVKATINDSVPVLYSSVVSVTYLPYFIPIIYNKVYMPGAYQAAGGYPSDWSPGDPFLASLKGDSKYEGYVNFGGGGNFKITSDPDWNHTNWGAGATAGSLSATGGDIGMITAAGYYRVNVNTSELTISVLKTTWSVIGSVTAPGYNWSNDMDLTYNPATKVWTGTANLKAGEFKFRANHDWGFAYGMGATAGKLDTSGPNIALPLDGNYTITLNFSVPPIYRYTVVKN
jgi:hypothetical protein